MMKKNFDVAPLDAADSELGLLLAIQENRTAAWRRELGSVDEDALVWQPFPGGHSIGALLLHIGEVELYWIEEVWAGKPATPEDVAALMSDQIEQYSVKWPVPPRQPLEAYFALLDGVRQRTKPIMLAAQHEWRSAEGGDQRFTARFLLQHVITHEAYHMGQAVLLKLQKEHAAR